MVVDSAECQNFQVSFIYRYNNVGQNKTKSNKRGIKLNQNIATNVKIIVCYILIIGVS